MWDGSDFWNPVTILGGTGTLGLIASLWPAARRGIAPGCFLALLVAALTWSDMRSDDLARATWTVSLIWGVLLTALHWSDQSVSDECAAAGLATESRALPLQLVMLAGLCLLSRAGDLVTLFLGLQLVSLGASVLTSRSGRPTRESHFPLSWLWLLGCVLLVAVTGSTRLETIHEALQTSYLTQASAGFKIAGGGSRVLTLSAICLGTALAGYAVCVPFHFGRFESLNEMLLPRAAALLAWIKLWPETITASESTAQLLIGVLAAITGVVPLLQARVERHLVKQWWLLAVAQGGWLLLAIAAWSFVRPAAPLNPAWPVVEWNLPTAAQAAWLLLLLDGVAVIGLSGVLAYLRRRERPVEFVEDLRGLFHFEPIAAVCACVCLLSLSGLPLLAGFWSRQFIALAAMNVRGDWGPPTLLVPHAGLLLLTACLALSAVWSAAIAMRSVWTMLFGLPLGQPRPVGAISSLFSAVLASVILIGCGVLPGPLLSWLCAPRVKQPIPQDRQKAPVFADRGGSR
ncbi:MAG: proton-conducting transporter membrane subunit [Planctomycetaceae bacterium]